MCPQCRAFITTDDKICPYCNNEVGPRAIETRRPADALGGLIPQARFTTVVLMLINTGLYVATLLYTSHSGGETSFDPTARALFDFGAKEPHAIALGQWWRLITAGFLHGGILHILMNMWVLFDLGTQSEEAFGTSRFLTIYLVSSITGFYASYLMSPSLSIGASAAICGLIGAMIAFGVRDGSAYGSAMRNMYARWAVYILIFSFLPGVDIWAHLGGIAGGFVVGYAAGGPGRNRAVEGLWRIAAMAMVALNGYAFFQMYIWLTHQT
jgi:rhomboid protease GluP